VDLLTRGSQATFHSRGMQPAGNILSLCVCVRARARACVSVRPVITFEIIDGFSWKLIRNLYHFSQKIMASVRTFEMCKTMAAQLAVPKFCLINDFQKL
jgi:hypothetical protein